MPLCGGGGGSDLVLWMRGVRVRVYRVGLDAFWLL